MRDWYRQIQTATNAIDTAIEQGDDEMLTLDRLSAAMGYSSYHMTRMFKALTGMRLRDYLRGRRLAFALLDVRDSGDSFLTIAVRRGFSSHEAFTRAFKDIYGLTPSEYREHPVPVVLRSKINPLDRYLLGKGEIGMIESNETLKIYITRIPAHRFLHIKNYDSHGYFDFWEKQEQIPGQDCDTVCGILDSIKGCLDGDENSIGKMNGQIMGYPQEAGGKRPEAYGIRMPQEWSGKTPDGMLILDIPEGEYIVFEHGPFDYDTQCGAIYQKMGEEIAGFDWTTGDYRPDDRPGRIAYYYNDPARFLKRVLPVIKV